jgi:hypothetical protein
MTHEELCRHAALLYAVASVLAWWDDPTAGVAEGTEPIEALRLAFDDYGWPPAQAWRSSEDGEA